MRRRLSVISLVAMLLVGVLPATAVGADDPPLVAGLVSIDGSPFAKSADVTLRLAPPTSSASRVRISNDAATWVEHDWAVTIPWSLIDPLAGGVDTDGDKTVTVDYGDGVTWSQRGVATILLDRVAPVVSDPSFSIDGQTWQGSASVTLSEDVAGVRYGLNGTTWTGWQQLPEVALYDLTGIGPWVESGRALYVQVRDAAGNTSNPVAGPTTLTLPQYGGDGSGPVNVTFEFPSFPVEGKPFTIKPVYPAGYTLPADAWCEWQLHWGDDESLMGGPPNEAWGEIIVERHKSKGVCAGWTFTIPHTNGRQFHWIMQIYRKDADQDWGYYNQALFFSGDNRSHIFRAAEGSTDRRFLTSSFAFAYLLPETTLSQKGDPVTYRLHTVGTTTVPQTGTFWTYPLLCYINPKWSQEGGTTFTYTPNCNGSWVTGWTGTMAGGYMRSQYDPIVDGLAPKVAAPVVKLRETTFGTLAPVTISWSASDTRSGVYAYQLQVSRNGGTWSSYTLPSRLTTSYTRSLATSGTYRFRVRARDGVGNWSGWVAGPTMSPRLIEQTSSSMTWSAGWSTVSNAAFSGGSARASATAGSTATLQISARRLAWITRSGPGRGLAQVYVDGGLAATIDLDAATLGPRRVAFTRTWGSLATHTITVKVLGTAGHPMVEVDGYLVVR